MVHAYYEFQHVELSKVGSGKKKVIRPPGGGSNIRFGDDTAAPLASPVSALRASRTASSIVFGGGDEGSTTGGGGGGSVGCCSDAGSSIASCSPPSTPLKSGSPAPPACQEAGTHDSVDNTNREATRRPSSSSVASSGSSQPGQAQAKRGRVPPGGHCTPFW